MALALIALVIILGAASGENTYIILCPQAITLGQPFKIDVNILNATDYVTVKVQVEQQWYNNSQRVKVPVVEAERDFQKGEPGTFTLTAPYESTDRTYYLRVTGRHGLNFMKETNLRLNAKIASVFIQTDKAMYKPGQTVHFRAFAVYPNLKPYTGNLDIKIADPNDNRIKQWIAVKDESGVIAREMILTDQPVNGDWKIIVSLPEFKQLQSEKKFTVKQYELPKFEVTVDLPPFALTSDRELTGTVKATYTFGKPVKGMVELRVFVGSIRDHCGNFARSVHKAFELDGKQRFSIAMEEIWKINRYLRNRRVNVVAHVREELTTKTLNGSSSVRYYQSPYKIEFLDSSPATFKPGLPYTAYIKVVQQDGRPIQEPNRLVQVFTCVEYQRVETQQSKYDCHRFTGTYSLPIVNLTLSADGSVLPLPIQIPENITQVKIRAYYGNVFASHIVAKSHSPSETFTQVSLKTKDLKTGQAAVFGIQSTEAPRRVFYKVMARGSVVDSGIVPGDGEKDLTFNLQTKATMSPTASVLVHFVRENGEVVADAISFNVDGAFENKVSLSFNKNSSEPREKIKVHVTADPDSFVNLLAVDQSVLLLKSGNDITVKQVLSELRSYDTSSPQVDFSKWYYPVSSTGVNTFEIFRNAGILVLTDCKNLQSYERRHYASYDYELSRFAGERGEAGPALMMSGRDSPPVPGRRAKQLPSTEPDTIRQVFPETWLWTNRTVGENGQVSITAIVPDTITSWIASAFALNPASGLGVAPTTTKLQVFQPFFVSLTLPISIIRNEQVVIQANVFSYLPGDEVVNVQLKQSKHFKNIMDPKRGKVLSSRKQAQTVTVRSGEPKAVYFAIEPRALGKIDLVVTARGFGGRDAVKRQLLVEPEGVKRENNIAVLVNPSADQPFSRVLTLSAPKKVVRGSQRFRVSATGDLLGPSIDNLESLLALPTGCGEQNMLKFVPNVFVADYLITTKQMRPELENRINVYLELGYQRQLYYQRHDGGFSAFGNRDAAGSTWLTAFVAKAFQQASKYTYVSKMTIDRTLRWLTDRQNLDGSFNEIGRVLDVQMQGEPGNHVALTSYVLLAFLENAMHDGKLVCKYRLGNTTEKALTYIENNVDSINDNYTLALTSYVLTLAKSDKADEVFQKLKDRAEVLGNKKFWTKPQESSILPRIPKPAPRSIDIVMTSYALLTYVARDEAINGVDIMTWITGQRNPHGGFSSSQDTIVALEALTKFAAKARPDQFQLELKLTIGNTKKEINIHQRNALVLQSLDFRKIPDDVKIEARGTGMALVELAFFYNVEREEFDGSSFEVKTVLLEDSLNGFTLMTCAKHLEKGKTGMCIQEIQMPSGFVPDLSSVGNIAGLKRLETQGRNVVAYFDELGESSTCMSLSASRNSLVAKTQTCYVSVKDYYEPSKEMTVSYQPRYLKNSNVCDVCPSCRSC